ncbi:flavin-containing monooxygenase [Cumulibacter soli]|uniref:flavin-containing monooxygenase n=1 Tax=Cumulibacter soli TaxID=2546344 RepID=UPI001ABB3F1A|nr:NAD(P)/FAD-dependent oxidoreductase [Cumulibacter soli]
MLNAEVTALRASQPVIAGDDELRDALEDANLPTLLAALAHLTGEDKWLHGEFQPTRSAPLDDNDSGGLSPAAQREARTAALNVLTEVRDGQRQIPAPPTPDEALRLLSLSLRETVPDDYATTMAQEAGFQARDIRWRDGRPSSAESFRALVIGAGLAGIAMARNLAQLGIEYEQVDKHADVGGVWWENTYPGAGVDTPSHLYSYSFAPNPQWSRYYAKQPEILAYIRDVADDTGVRNNCRFGCEVISAHWDAQDAMWDVVLRENGTESHERYNAVISCVGILNQPSVPPYEGMDDLRIPAFHSARWDHSVDHVGKRVAVIGTGASAMQIVPALAGTAADVFVFQRTPQWVVPSSNYHRDLTRGSQTLMSQMPYYAAFYRLRLTWLLQDKLLSTLHRDPQWPHQDRSINARNDRIREAFTQHITTQLDAHPDLIAQTVPAYPPYLKRILMDNNWLQTIQRPDVHLVSNAVSALYQDGVITDDGARHRVDLVVFATGFHSHRMLWPMDIVGARGRSLRDVWGDDNASAYLGIGVPEFPNLFMVGGPHTAIGHGGSAIYPAECAAAYIAQILVRMIEEQWWSIEPRADITEQYNAEVDREHESLIWTHPGATNWYRNSSGRVTINTPFRGVDYWRMTERPRFEDYVIAKSSAKDVDHG